MASVFHCSGGVLTPPWNTASPVNTRVREEVFSVLSLYLSHIYSSPLWAFFYRLRTGGGGTGNREQFAANPRRCWVCGVPRVFGTRSIHNTSVPRRVSS